MFERPAIGQTAVIVHVAFGERDYSEADREFRELVRSADADVKAHIGGSRLSPDPRYFVGGGKADDIAAAITDNNAALAVFNHDLSPSQERNLEKRLGARVLDRAGLILDIFSRRARSHEGKLQVELAQLRHLATRLVRGWSHLERQRGGIGLRGPGETQLEVDRRLVDDRIALLQKRLRKVAVQRDQSASARRHVSNPLVSMVGYTNAGKSTLFNMLTDTSAYTADKLFATLDPTLRRMSVDVGDPLIVSDTVGFIRDLPHELIAAFRATLEQTRDADLLLHVVDVSNPEQRDQMREVETVLTEIGAGQLPVMAVYNKIDQLAECEPRVEVDTDGHPVRAFVSAETGEGVAALREALGQRCRPDIRRERLEIPAAAGRLRADIYELGQVTEETGTANGNLILDVTASIGDLEAAASRAGWSLSQLRDADDQLTSVDNAAG
ncbi:GTPase HflX [Salinisphaera sp. USBA-960]|uniref:ribosome rescue GTPase HflX n=1 Tax=Salinisphaera orenii TaxID=856731 RepID=UPI000DBE5F30|nr:GTPase HflX [Salifodinibacter halophilus]NNC26055.1 GTPase HflX [Salifodinibacter halophilus]